MTSMMGIKSISRGRLAEGGKIKIGALGEERTSKRGGTYRLPMKLDYFTVTTTERDAEGRLVRDTEVHDAIGDKPRELRVTFASNDPFVNFPVELAYYKARKRVCHGNREVCERWNEQAGAYEKLPCSDIPNCQFCREASTGTPLCKWHGILNCILLDLPRIGIFYKFRTTGRHSIEQISDALAMNSSLTGGILAGLPFKLRLVKQRAEVNGEVHEFPVVHLYADINVPEFQRLAFQLLEARRTNANILHEVDNNTRLMLMSGEEVPDEIEQIEAEYTPVVSEARAALGGDPWFSNDDVKSYSADLGLSIGELRLELAQSPDRGHFDARIRVNEDGSYYLAGPNEAAEFMDLEPETREELDAKMETLFDEEPSVEEPAKPKGGRKK